MGTSPAAALCAHKVLVCFADGSVCTGSCRAANDDGATPTIRTVFQDAPPGEASAEVIINRVALCLLGAMRISKNVTRIGMFLFVNRVFKNWL